jgi:hypothetical protein
MKVLNLQCSAQQHRFEGWFGSEADYSSQRERGLLQCPVCGCDTVERLPSAPRLNLSGATAPVASAPSAGTAPVPEPVQRLQAAWKAAVREVIERTEDVGERFPEEARRIHYGESAQRGIRGQASAEERQALREEGIETFALPVPPETDPHRH